MKIFNKAQLAGAVFLATAGIAAGTAQADSLLAPLVVDDSAWNTYFAFKMQGANGFVAGNPTDRIHYTWIQKGTEWVHLLTDYVDLGANPFADNDDVAYGPRPCTMYDNYGAGTANDVIFQDARGVSGTIVDVTAGVETSAPNGYNNRVATAPRAFAGMVVIDDDANVDTTGLGSSAPEGNFSGFAYLVNPTANLMLDYKLLNNHHKAGSGDFSIQFISKHVVDLMWLPDNTAGAVITPVGSNLNPSAGTFDTRNTTNWYAAVTGPDMTKHTAAQGGYNSTYGLQVTLGVNPFGAGMVPNERTGLTLESAPTLGFAQAYNNDEAALSGAPDLTITCAGFFQRDQFLTGPQAASANGGWARRSVIPLTDQFAGANTPKVAEGAIIYRSDAFTNVDGVGANNVTLQVETGGHLNTNANHVNRPY